MKTIVIHYNEIAIKGENRWQFEKILIDNIKNKIEKIAKKIYKLESRVIVEYSEKEEEIIEKLKKIFGISYIGIGIKTKREENEVIDYIKKNKKIFSGKSIKVETKRSDKNYPVNSMEFSRKIGEFMYEKLKTKVDLSNPEVIVNIEILKDCFIVYMRRENGLDGLPVRSSGRVLSLLSGGIDSIISSWGMMKRGCVVDFLHVAPYPAKEVKKSKIMKIVKKLEEYGNNGKLYVVPYTIFYKYAYEKNPRYELVLFRKFLYSVAERICEKEEVLGIVSGDSLGQVASQTLENMNAATYGIKIPIYRPLISFNKIETIELAKKIGAYELAIEKYRDCCSLSSVKHPVTMAKREKLEKLAKEVDLEKIIEEAIEHIEIIK
ncbi:MAG: tRNA 4-thiouridine(8) synthase ThiI [Candidatus ainarchaeum sp.]|nr:tRNA 4-thiouridine(8) synthase ThiI [Candidatus ainarchaeum sp.]